MEQYQKLGYLNSEFKLFHLTDVSSHEFEYHYHDFDKIVIFIKGNVTYNIEGKSYALKPYDIVLVNHHDIHKPDIDPSVTYERIVVYISPNFMEAYHTEQYDLSYCFQKARAEKSSVLRIPSWEKSSLFQIMNRLERSFSDNGYANDLYRQILFLEFMIKLNRATIDNRVEFIDTRSSNTKVTAILTYINENLTSNLSIDALAQTFFISKYYMMRLFKAETGYTIGNYISYKRLLLAKELIANGSPITEACFNCGFKDYSTFSRAYKSLFGKAPRDA